MGELEYQNLQVNATLNLKAFTLMDQQELQHLKGQLDLQFEALQLQAPEIMQFWRTRGPVEEAASSSQSAHKA